MNLELTARKWAAASQIIAIGAIEHLAKKEGISEAQVRTMISTGHEGAIRQFEQLITAGINTAFEMHDAGQICMIAE